MDFKEKCSIGIHSNKLVRITEKTKATLLFGNEWLILVSHVVKENGRQYRVYRHASYDIQHNMFYVDRIPQAWGFATGIKFYEATDEQKKFMINKLTKKGFKFVKILNRLIER